MSGSPRASYSTTMKLLNNIDPLKSNTGTQYYGPSDPETPGRDGGSVYELSTDGLTQENEEKSRRFECVSCMYYEPGRVYCTYIHTPISILFVCPQTLDNRR